MLTELTSFDYCVLLCGSSGLSCRCRCKVANALEFRVAIPMTIDLLMELLRNTNCLERIFEDVVRELRKTGEILPGRYGI